MKCNSAGLLYEFGVVSVLLLAVPPLHLASGSVLRCVAAGCSPSCGAMWTIAMARSAALGVASYSRHHSRKLGKVERKHGGVKGNEVQ